MKKKRLILASRSIYRKILLSSIRANFECISPNIDETRKPNEKAQEMVKRLSIEKAEKVGFAGAWIEIHRAAVTGSWVKVEKYEHHRYDDDDDDVQEWQFEAKERYVLLRRRERRFWRWKFADCKRRCSRRYSRFDARRSDQERTKTTLNVEEATCNFKKYDIRTEKVELLTLGEEEERF